MTIAPSTILSIYADDTCSTIMRGLRNARPCLAAQPFLFITTHPSLSSSFLASKACEDTRALRGTPQDLPVLRLGVIDGAHLIPWVGHFGPSNRCRRYGNGFQHEAAFT